MTIEYGRTYLVDSSHLTSEAITPWSDGTVTVRASWAERLSFDHATVEDIDRADRFLASLVRRLLDDAHEGCGWEWGPHPSGGGLFRIGRCPACGGW